MSNLPNRNVEKLVAHLEALIASGVFGVGAKLPSERELARRFDIPASTVSRALRQLAARGVLCRRQGAGSFVRMERAEPDGAMRIAVIADNADATHTYCGHIINGIRQSAGVAGCEISLHVISYYNVNLAVLQRLTAGCDGCILTGCFDLVLDDLPRHCPCVGVTMHNDYGLASIVDLDPTAAAEYAATFFAGRRVQKVFVFTYAGLENRQSVFMQRADAFAAEWHRRGGNCEIVVRDWGEPDQPEYFADAAAGYLYTSGHRFQIAAEVYQATLGRKLEDERTVLTIDGKSLLVPEFHQVNTIGINYVALGQAAFDECMRRVSRPGDGPRRIYLRPFLHTVGGGA